MLSTQIGVSGTEEPSPCPAGGTESCSYQVSEALYAKADIWGWLVTEDGSLCGGRYVEPVRNWAGADLDVREAPLNASADKSLAEGDIVALTGGVQLRKGGLSVDAGSAQFNRETDTLWVDQSLVLRQEGVMMRAETAELSGSTGLGTLRNAKFVSLSTGTRVQADVIERTSETTLELNHASYTQCAPDNETWLISADYISLNYDTGIGIAKDSRIRINGTQVVRLPYLQFPVDDRRMTGVLWPSIGTSDGGLDLALPVYLNLAENYDATITPRFLQKHGAMLETEGRYLDDSGEWTLSGAFLSNDKDRDRDRWLAALKKTSNENSRIQTNIDFTKVSDQDYFSDLGTAALSLKRESHLNQIAEISYTGHYLKTTLSSERYQTIGNVDEPYQRLPELVVERLNESIAYNILPIAQLRYTEFDHKDAIRDGGTEITGNRLFIEAGAELPISRAWGSLTSTIKTRHLQYSIDNKHDSGFDEDPKVNSLLASVDGRLRFDRQLEFNDTGYTQTLEPRAVLLYAEHEDQVNNPDFDTTQLPFSYSQIFRESRFSGYDRLDDADQVALGVTSRLIDQNEGREILSASLGRIQYFDDRRTRLPGVEIETSRGSAFAAGLRYSPTASQQLSSDILWDSHDEQIDQFGVNWHQSRTNTIINLGYSFRRFEDGSGLISSDRIEQVDASVAYLLNERWRLYGRLNYDIEENRWLENLIGFEYESCCWRGRVLFQRSLEPGDSENPNRSESDEAILFEIQLKGLGGLGSTLNSVLEESIFGYKPR